MLCDGCRKRPAPLQRLYGPPNLCRQCREVRVTPCETGAADVRMSESHIPRRWRVIDKDVPLFSRVSRIVEMAWVNDQGLLIEGAVGVGKTFAAALLCHRLLARSASVQWVSVPDLADSLRKQTPLVSVEKMKTVQHLVLDDLGAEYDKSGYWFSILYQIVNVRYSNHLPTTATCNAFKQIEPRVLRRIAETALVVTMERE